VIDRTTKSIAALSDEDLQRQVAPNKNRIYYLLGHLTATSDRLLPLLRLSERLRPELDDQFLTSPDRSYADKELESAELRKVWSEVNEKLTKLIETLQPEQWLERHASVSEEDFAKEPHRNRLAVLISRINHVAYHQGQIQLTK
jgi:uncharacterized damage-inducible protein DinB